MIFAEVPSDKSITHRAIIFAAMAKGTSRISRPLCSADIESTIQAMRSVGVKIERDAAGDFIVQSNGLPSFKSPQRSIDCGNSGTTARLLMGLFSGIPDLSVELTGDESLSKRPMNRVVEPLRLCGATISWQGRSGNLPVRIIGQQLKFQSRFDVDSAQVKSALLLAAVASKERCSLKSSDAARRHTEEFLKWLGAPLNVSNQNHIDSIQLEGEFVPKAFHIAIPSDPSSAAFIFALAAIGKKQITIPNLLFDPSRGFYLEVLKEMGCEVSFNDLRLEGPIQIADVKLSATRKLKSVQIKKEVAGRAIDEIPILAVCAAFAEGVTTFEGVQELRVKESDRLTLTIQLLNSAGVKAWTEGDALYVRGAAEFENSFEFDPKKDHRMIMAAKILSIFLEGECQIADTSYVEVSFPRFFEEVEMLKTKLNLGDRG